MKRNSIIFSALLACSLSSIAQSQTETFFSVTSADNQAQGMAMVLATQMAEQKAAVRILLCGPAGQLALKAYEPPALKPRNVTPMQMMAGLIKGGATVEVCALFLPNADKAPARSDRRCLGRQASRGRCLHGQTRRARIRFLRL